MHNKPINFRLSNFILSNKQPKQKLLLLIFSLTFIQPRFAFSGQG